MVEGLRCLLLCLRGSPPWGGARVEMPEDKGSGDMEYIIEFILDLLVEGTIEILPNKKVSNGFGTHWGSLSRCLCSPL